MILQSPLLSSKLLHRTAPVLYVLLVLFFVFKSTMPVSSLFFGRAATELKQLPTIPQALGFAYLKWTLHKTRFSSHVVFLRTCIRRKIIPNSFKLKFGSTSTKQTKILQQASLSLMSQVTQEHVLETEKADRQITTCKKQLFALCHPSTAQFIIVIVKEANRALYQSMQETKTKKLKKLLPTKQHQDIATPSPDIDQLVVTIPDDVPLPAEQKQLLSRGLKFVPLKPKVNFMSTLFHCYRYFRRLRLAAHFANVVPPSVSKDPSEIASLFPRQPSTWTPKPGEFSALDNYIDTCTHEINKLNPKPLEHSNLTAQELKALNDLKQRKDVVIKPADKGGAIVVWRADLYQAEVEKQLSDTTFYEPRHKSTVKEDNAIVRKTIKEAIQANQLPPEATRAVVKEPRESRFYVVPKIHKINNPGRPIVSACSCPTAIISEFLDTVFQPLVANLPTYIKDTTHALQLLNDFQFPPDSPNRFIFTMDITGLYTNIPHAEGLRAVQHFLKKSTQQIDPTIVVRLAELVLTLNAFSFGEHHFAQTRGVAMGTKMGPSYACLFVGHLEEQIFLAYKDPLPAFFKRFIDDCLGIAICCKEDLLKFITFVGNFNPAINFTHEISESTLPFLDIQISITDSKCLDTTVHYKTTDSHSYLTFTSSHPKATKESIPYSQFLRLRRLCSTEKEFSQQADIMASFMKNRGYPDNIVTEAILRAKHVPRRKALETTSKDQSKDRTILTLVYHPHNIIVKNILLDNFRILQKDPKLKDVFAKPPLVAYLRDTSLRNQLVHSSFQPPSGQPPGNKSCLKPKCKACPFLNTTTTTFKGPSGNSFTIRSSFTCQSTNVVYIISCCQCNKMYVGETYRTLAERLEEHVRAVRCQTDTPVSNHFNSDYHHLQHMSIAAVWQNHTDFVHRKFLESNLITRLGTTKPQGLNIRD